MIIRSSIKHFIFPDISLLITYLIVVGSVFVIVNTVVDILYGLINPTVRIAGRK